MKTLLTKKIGTSEIQLIDMKSSWRIILKDKDTCIMDKFFQQGGILSQDDMFSLCDMFISSRK